MKTVTLLLVSFCFLSLTIPLTAAERYAMFLIDQGESMNLPYHQPRLERAIDSAIANLHDFIKQSEADRSVPHFKVVTFSGDIGYFERMDWTTNPHEALEILEFLREDPGLDSSPIKAAMYFAAEDLTGKTQRRYDRVIYLYTHANAGDVEDSSLEGVIQQVEFKNTLEKGSKIDLSEAAVWKMVQYEDAKEDKEEEIEEETKDLIEHLTDLSQKTWSFLNRTADPKEEELESQKAYTTVNQYHFFNSGKYSNKIYVHTSSTGSSWSSRILDSGGHTSSHVSAARLNDYTYVFYRGESSTSIYYSWNKPTSSVVWYGNTAMVSNITNVGPAAITVNGVIRLYFLRGSGVVSYVESTGASSSGALYWSTIYDTSLTSASGSGALTVAYDPSTNKEYIFIKELYSGSPRLYSSPLGNNSWSIEKTFNADVLYPTIIAANNDLHMTYLRNRDYLYKASRAGLWLGTQINLERTDRTPGLAFADRLVTVFKVDGSNDIRTASSLNNGSTWSGYTAPEHTTNGIGAIGFSYLKPLSCSISGSSFYGFPGDSFTWYASASGGNSPYTYKWYIDGSYQGSGTSLTKSFLFPDTYQVMLEVIDSDGTVCYKTTQVNIVDCSTSSGLGREPCLAFAE